MEEEKSFADLFSLRTLAITNALDMFLYMLLIYWLCGGGNCIQEWNWILFVFQLLINFGLCAWLIHRERADYRFLWINILWLAALFFVFSFVQGYF